MSLEAMAICLNHSKAKGAAKVVLIGIANHLGPDAEEGAWPAQARLARYANITERGVRKAIDSLIELGEVVVAEHDGKSSSRNKPNRYFINLTCPETCDRTPAHRERLTTGTNQSHDRNFSPTTGTFLPDDRNSSSGEPIREPLLRTSNKPSKIDPNFTPQSFESDQRENPLVDLEQIRADFISYWAAAGGKKIDWEATWRNNLRKVKDWPQFQKPKSSAWDAIEESK